MGTSPGTARSGFRCQIAGCRSETAPYLVERAAQIRHVCRRCAEEMIALFGWALAGLPAPAAATVAGSRVH